MEVRPYRSGDAQSLDALLEYNVNGDVRLDRDRIIVCRNTTGVVGCLVWRPGAIVHELRTRPTLGRRAVADALLDFAVNDALSRDYGLHESVFVTDSDVAADYFISRGAHLEKGKHVFTLPLSALTYETVT